MDNVVCLCDKRPDDDIDVYKDFIQLIRRKELEEPFILVTEDTTENLKKIVRLILDTKLVDGHYHVYFGQVKKLIKSFVSFYSSVMDDVIRETDTYTNEAVRDDLLFLIEHTISVNQNKQVHFGKSFLPVNTPWEKRTYDEIENLYEGYIKKLEEIKNYIHLRLDRQNKVLEFAKEHFQITVRKMNDKFDTAHLFLGMLLADRIRETRVSLEEILRRLRNNLKCSQQEHEETVNQLLTTLYEKNKEIMAATRRDWTDSEAIAELNRGIDTLRSKLANYEVESPVISRLEQEVAYWRSKVDNFNEIADNLTSLRKLQGETVKQQNEYHLLKCNQLVGCKHHCEKNFRLLYSQRRHEIQHRIINETRALITFYAVRGSDNIIYSDNIGPYYVDEYNHINYVFDYGLEVYHECDGTFAKHVPEFPYQFDKFGRYIEKNGNKLYQCAPCTSLYKLNDANCLDKVTKYSDHSEKISDSSNVGTRPDVQSMDIKNCLPAECVRHLWECVGQILSDALCDVGTKRPNNPIHYLAHKLLQHKYKRTSSELEQKKKEAVEYRDKNYKDRKERAEAASRRWLSGQVPRRKPEECDDEDTRACLDAQLNEQLYIMSINHDIGN